MANIDDARISARLADVARSYGVDLKKNGHEFTACCPFHEDDTPSFTIFTGRDGVERFKCFGCDAHGDVVDFVQLAAGVDVHEAKRILLGNSPARESRPAQREAKPKAENPYAGIRPLRFDDHPFRPGVAAATRLFNPKSGKSMVITPQLVHEYRDERGQLTGLVLRRPLSDGGKETPMVQWAELPSGEKVWCRLPFPRMRNLYRLHELGDAPRVVLVEGEKAADALAGLGLPLPALTWPGGVNGVQHVNWTPLAQREVILWPDADEPGERAMSWIAAHLRGLGSQIRVVQQ